eukprot:6378444-Amphidinium_carterae.1
MSAASSERLNGGSEHRTLLIRLMSPPTQDAEDHGITEVVKDCHDDVTHTEYGHLGAMMPRDAAQRHTGNINGDNGRGYGAMGLMLKLSALSTH